MVKKARNSGFRFDPQDHELIEFLECKVKGEPMPVEGVILEADLYGEKEPWEIFQELGGKKKKSRYFFTRLKKKKELGRQYFRRVGLCGGTWNGETRGKPIYGGGNREKAIGVRKSFSYLNKSLKEKEGSDDDQVDRRYKWLMTEFTLSADSLKDLNLKHLDYAVCRIRKKDKFKKGRNDDDSDSDSEHNVVDDGGGGGGGDELDDTLAQILDDYKSSLGQAEIGNEEPLLYSNLFQVTNDNVQKSSLKQEEISNEELLLYANPFQVTDNIDQKSGLAQVEIGNEEPLLYTNPFQVTNNIDQKSGLAQVEISKEEPLLYANPFQVADNIDQKSGLAQVEIGKEEPLLYTYNPFHVTNNIDQWGCLEQVDDSVLYTNPFMMINNWNSNVSGNYPTIWTKL